MTERLYEGQPDRETQKSPLGVHGSLGAFRLVSSMEHSRNSIFSICDSPQKSSAAQKVYRADRPASGFRSWTGSPLSNLSVIAARCHLPYRGEALAYRKVSPFPRNPPSSPEAPLLGELSPKVTERLYEGQPDRETQKSPLGVAAPWGLFIW